MDYMPEPADLELLNFHPDVLSLIVAALDDPRDVLAVRGCCRRLRDVCTSTLLKWKTLELLGTTPQVLLANAVSFAVSCPQGLGATV